MDSVDLLPGRPITLAILAMGGQGGGVLGDWIVDLAEHSGWIAQSTSVPGVAQRTGATIYYVELFPGDAAKAAGRPPVLSLMPAPGDIDIVVAAELMEAGRAIQRGLVTPDRTTLISSSHRSYAVAEKAAPGNGIADPNKVIAAGRAAAKRFYCLDMAKLAEDVGSVISASLFGGIAGAGVLPFPREAFEETIRRSGVGVAASLRAFEVGFQAVAAAPEAPETISLARPIPEVPARAASPAADVLLQQVLTEYPASAQPWLVAGLKRLADFQDLAYCRAYLARMARILALDSAGHDWVLTTEAARHVAVAMSYDDVIRVADLKTRAGRTQRVRDDVRAAPDQIVNTTEYMHPRLEEIRGLMPAGLGRWMESSPVVSGLLGRLFVKGRRVKSSSLMSFLVLYVVGGMKRLRLVSLRHEREMAHLGQWLDRVARLAPIDYALAVEAVRCRRLVKGYSDTHDRGQGKFSLLMEAADRLAGHPEAAARLAALRDAALADEAGDALREEMTSLPQPALT